jgi:hypothetical protein
MYCKKCILDKIFTPVSGIKQVALAPFPPNTFMCSTFYYYSFYENIVHRFGSRSVVECLEETFQRISKIWDDGTARLYACRMSILKDLFSFTEGKKSNNVIRFLFPRTKNRKHFSCYELCVCFSIDFSGYGHQRDAVQIFSLKKCLLFKFHK